MTVMGREGYVACAKAVAERQMQYMNASAIMRRIIMSVFPFVFFLAPVLWGAPSGVQNYTSSTRE
jgi:hypothetical protein